jgi:hypothetical protein
MTIEVKAPAPYNTAGKIAVFLAGSIEMDTAERWQEKVVKMIDHPDVMFLNPRRDDWDASWKQEKDDPDFSEQVEWELDSMELADVIFFYFAPGTKSPITLLELGLMANSDKPVVVCCPEGFWRKGNVDIVCERTGIRVYEDLVDMITKFPENIEFLLEAKRRATEMEARYNVPPTKF